MSTNRTHRIDHDTAERLLDGAGVGAGTDHEALARLLAAAAAPAAEHELPGEEAAVAVFRTARLAPAAASGRSRTSCTSRSHRRRPARTPAVFLAAKVAVAVLATAVGGVAVAAGTGHLPAVMGGESEDGAPGHSPSAGTRAPGARAPGTPADAPSGSSSAAPPDLAGGPSGATGDPPAPRPTDSPHGAAPPAQNGRHEAGDRPGTPRPTRSPGAPAARPTGPPATAPSPPRKDPPATRPAG
ncbi:hypothetical protein OG239_19745 [Streptomyces sp. NBC_00868]|uniref:hypothetical protein n=1 Tax=unclassified Streptomyces TaxID=2593676 RepID=UPI0032540219|nr:hypothetical protein OG239_19745 [Streptomyces sp. NBC_00868]